MKLSDIQWKKLTLTLLRVAIGWHFIYEGLVKLMMSDWSAASYLANSTGFLSGFYTWLASDGIIGIVDTLNIVGLILIGLALFVGFLTRISAAGGILLLLLYYFAYPPWGISLFGSAEGHFFLVNKNLIEALVLLLFVVRRDTGWGIDMLLRSQRLLNDALKLEKEDNPGMPVEEGVHSSRREVLKNLATLPFLGALGWGAFARDKKSVDVMSGATIRLEFPTLAELQGKLPAGKIKDHEITRLVMGGNMIGGFAHARDLRYVSNLFKAYNTEAKVYETMMLAERAGINAINIGFRSNELMAKYKKISGSKIKVISQVPANMKGDDPLSRINEAIDYGADIIQVQGNWCDWLVRDGRLDIIEKMLDKIRSQGYTAGLGAHTVDSLMICEDEGIIPDYYMKTLHHDNYWSAHPRENRKPYEVDGKQSPDHNMFHNNCFCPFPEKSVGFVQNTKVPVMGFKVLAAGAIDPKDGFNWAFRNGADFICVGMFDFQLVDDVNIAINVLDNLEGRKREWYG